MSGDSSKRDDAVRAHLRDVEDGCGCAEVWEHLSESRDAESGERCDLPAANADD